MSSAVFGQPLTAVLDQDKSRNVTSPVRTYPPAESPVTPSTGHNHPVS